MKMKTPAITLTLALTCFGAAGWWVLQNSHSPDSEGQVAAQIRKQKTETKKPRSHQGEDFSQDNLGNTDLEQKPKPYARISRRFAGMDTSVLKHAGEEANHGATLDDTFSAGNDIPSVIATEKDSLNVRERIKVLKEMDTLLPGEVDKLMQFVESGVKPAGMRGSSYHWLVDQIFTSVRDLSGDPEAFSQRLAALSGRQGADMVVRDYAVQHMGHLQHEGGDMQAIRSALKKNIGEKQGTLAGTTLLALQSGGDAQETIVARSMAVASNPAYSSESRVTALKLASRQPTKEIIELAESIVSDDESSEHLSIVAQSILKKTNDN